MTDEGEAIISRLTAEQVETLRHVYQHKGSKEIARLMGVSPHTVDQRMRRTLRKLQLSSRVEAAQLLARNGVFENVTPYQSLRYQTVDLDEGCDVADGSVQLIYPEVSPLPSEDRPQSEMPLVPHLDEENAARVGGVTLWLAWLVGAIVIGGGAVAILYSLLSIWTVSSSR